MSSAHLVHPERVLAHLDGKALEGLRYRHPFMGRESPVVLGEHVTLEAGTGLVHTAPGHGQEDYQVGLAYGLEILNPVDGAGRFTAEAGKYAGKKIFEANPEIVADLHASGHLLSDPKASLRHSYPHCWRCHNPVVFRATDQWFLSLEHAGLRKTTLDEIDRVPLDPALGARAHLRDDREPAGLVPVAPAHLGRADPGLLLRGLRRAARVARR